MDKEQAIAIVREYKKAVLAIYKDAEVYLYGSYNKGTATKDSDIDVAVIVPHRTGNWFEEIPPLWKASRQINSLIEPVLMEYNEPSPLYENVIRTGTKC
ncbi:MAG: nucleotidyltransferase domain-containing protein [Paludibacteraceae bacterium]|nr:nucleotidyltransferase domain-containing protein [Paludibacteraceae bacterium]